MVALKEGHVSVITKQQARTRWKGSLFWYEMENLLRKERMHFSKAEVLLDFVMGEIIWHPSKELPKQQIHIVYYLDRKELVLIGEDASGDFWKQKIQSMAGREEELSPVRFFLRLLDELLKEEGKYLQRMETVCFRMEEAMGQKKPLESVDDLIVYRRSLLKKSFQFQQMTDMSDTLAANVNDFFEEKEVECIRNYGKKVERLHNRTAMLRDYILQLLDWKRQQMEEQKDKIMRMLTMVTTIFFPLTVITGWYGMNFAYMPELKKPHGYLYVAVLCFCIVAGEILYFHKKKLL